MKQVHWAIARSVFGELDVWESNDDWDKRDALRVLRDIYGDDPLFTVVKVTTETIKRRKAK